MLRVTTHTIKLLSDLTTPVSVFLKLREHFPEILLLESSDYSSREDSQSFICCAPLLTLTGDESGYTFENHTTNTKTVDFADDAVSAVENVLSQIKTVSTTDAENRFSGIFGYTGFDTVGEFRHCVTISSDTLWFLIIFLKNCIWWNIVRKEKKRRRVAY
jgi:anthranilate synthase component 1